MPVEDFECLRAAIGSYEDQCGGLGGFGLSVQVLVNVCHHFAPEVLEKALAQTCARYSNT